MATENAFRRILLKLSGEALMGDGQHGIDYPTVSRLAGEIATVHATGVEICLVIGGGNIIRGASAAAAGMDRASADYMGMLATVINALAMQNSLEVAGSNPGSCRRSRCRRCASPLFAAGRCATWKKTGWSFSRGNRQSVLYDRFSRGAAGRGNELPGLVQGHAGGRGLFGGSGGRPQRHKI